MAKYSMPIDNDKENIKRVTDNPFDIRYVYDASEAVELAAVTKDGCAIQFIKNPSPAVQLAAIKSDPRSIWLLESMHIAVDRNVINDCKYDIIRFMLKKLSKAENRHNLKAVRFIYEKLRYQNFNWPELDIIENSLRADKLLENPNDIISEENLINLVTRNPEHIEFIKNPSVAVQLAAIQRDFSTIRFIKNPSKQVKLAAIKMDADAIIYMNPDKYILRAAISQSPKVIRLFDTIPIDILNDFKKEIIVFILKSIKHSMFPVERCLSNLYNSGVTWPELDIIKNSIEADNKLLETIDYNNLSKELKIIRTKIENRSEEEQLAAVQKNPYAIQTMDNPSLEVQLVAVKQDYDGYIIKFIKNPSVQVQLAAVKKNPYAIQYIDDPALEAQLIAVKESKGDVIDFIKNPIEEVQLAAVQINYRKISYIDNPTLKVQLAALHQNTNILLYIKNPLPEIFVEYKSKIIKNMLSKIKDDISILNFIKYLDKNNVNWPELDVIKKSLRADGKLLESIDYNNMSEKEKLAVVQEYPYGIRFIANPSLAVQLAAVQKYGYAIRYIKNPSELVQLAAVQQFAFAFGFIKEPTKDVVITAILKLIQLNNEYNYVKKLIKEYDHNNWPEIETIKDSLRAEGIVLEQRYPIASKSEWYGNGTYKSEGGKLVYMSPDEFLNKVRPLKIDDDSRENIDILKQHISQGKTLDPLVIYKNGKEDGRHRAYAAKELGIKRVPVIVF